MAATLTKLTCTRRSLNCLLWTPPSRGYVPRGYFREKLGYVPTLSPPEVTSLLIQNEVRVERQVKAKYVVGAFESNQVASNNPIEDRRAVGRLTNSGATLYGIFDGHGGPSCAQAVSERLLDYISVALLSPEELEQFSHTMRSDVPMELIEHMSFMNAYSSPTLTSRWKASLQKFVVESLSMSGFDDEHIEGSLLGEALKTAFKRLDNDLSSEAMPVANTMDEDMIGIALSGACACVAHVDGLNLHVANSGDCRAVLGKLEDSNKWCAIPLSVDHNPDNGQEVSRLKKAHPKSESGFIIKSNRLLSQLIPLRAFGDVRYKWRVQDLKILEAACGHTVIPMNYYTPPYLTVEPEIRFHRLGPRDKFLVIASDGLWEMLPSEDVVRLVGEYLEARDTENKFHAGSSLSLGNINRSLKRRQQGLSHNVKDSNAATHLIRHALGFEHRLVSEMLTFPPYVARNYRDDITITVIFFDEDFILNQYS
ncbi:hypothetical protein CAPTEDRAFT_174406 [Capitella teleta]|uniref:PPM-type phosphatase domain-containing protein n=1 Tax=Capitella teleta TaxID=283909 RepID=R7U8G3_CAPTE|nr:hypothetical protein CAPTEDRAFT_174406 [Capitella teleta]|eukprot:ELU02670.1 hypothetical protein CAPTEDRAFT_174406 [Capitella teleta]